MTAEIQDVNDKGAGIAEALRRLVRILPNGLTVRAAGLFVRRGASFDLVASSSGQEGDCRRLTAAWASLAPGAARVPDSPAGAIRDGAPIARSQRLMSADGTAFFLVIIAEAGSAAFNDADLALLGDLAIMTAPHLMPYIVEDGDEAYFRDAINALPEATAIFDKDERFLFWNRKFAQLYCEDVPLKKGVRFEDHMRAVISTGAIVSARGCEEQWLKERVGRLRHATGSHDFMLYSGRWLRSQDRALPNGGRISIRSDITELVEREQSFKLLFESHPLPMLVVDVETLGIVDVNTASIDFYGYSRDELLALRLPDIRPESEEGEIGWYLDNLDDADIADRPRIHRLKSGELRAVRVSMEVVERNGRKVILAAFFDVTERQRMEEEIRRTRGFLRHVVDHIPVALFVKDMQDDGRYVLYNKAGQDVFGMETNALLGLRDTDLYDAGTAAKFRRQDEETLRLGSLDFIEDETIVGSNGETRSIHTRKVALKDDASNALRYVLGLSEDVTAQRAHEAEIAHLAHHDSLTGLANRMLFETRLGQRLKEIAAAAGQLAVFFIDLDGFKSVNDTLGHAAGDALLRMAARRLEDVLRADDTVARFGGDEFAVLAGIRQTGEASWIAARLVTALSEPYVIDGRSLDVTASIGVSLAPEHGLHVATLMECADSALYAAKRAGKGRFTMGEAARKAVPFNGVRMKLPASRR